MNYCFYHDISNKCFLGSCRFTENTKNESWKLVHDLALMNNSSYLSVGKSFGLLLGCRSNLACFLLHCSKHSWAFCSTSVFSAMFCLSFRYFSLSYCIFHRVKHSRAKTTHLCPWVIVELLAPDQTSEIVIYVLWDFL